MEKKKGYAGGIVGFILLTIFCFSMSFVMFVGGDMDYLLGEDPKDINEIVQSSYPQKDEYVKLDSYLTIGQFAQTKHKINMIIPAGTEKHYLVMLEDGSVIAVTVKNKKTIKKLDKQIDSTWEYVQGTSTEMPSMLKIEGQLSTMDYKIEGFYKDYLNDIGYNNSMGDIHYLSIDMTMNRVKGWAYVIIPFVLGVIFLVSSILTIRKAHKAKKDAKENDFLNNYK